ncbi:uncharacterized protein L969DRAFT_96073 [Mixia osmundae IAM 14324]|uniref:Uncharacterized protein n=1 Tax=Mixia osmundae (strain CBS 9802 / IAM 14324 / JCM 22182 / KY 12970) TaxID=764103 RepID=G7DS42_MIXOS|nr:uncharacterized protein L969DRAFT_96073 [Mixia osmundae IAM 14324]KEI37543.1 hypothetical protein L969DRAFT_96073 [Mixia osmundae IAM 14324]GAA93402.1 hypothetical protein E5Q_00043 [Mixia osmundae IAM 14324]
MTEAEPQVPEQVVGQFALAVFDVLALWPALRIAIQQGHFSTAQHEDDGSEELRRSPVGQQVAPRASIVASSSAPAKGSRRTREQIIKQKKVDLAEEIIDAFVTSTTSDAALQRPTIVPVPDKSRMQAFLKEFVEYEFSVLLDDQSERAITAELSELWREIWQRFQANTLPPAVTTAGKLEDLAQRAARARQEDGAARQSLATRMPSEYDGDSDLSPDDESSDGDGVSDEDMQIDDAPQARAVPIIDEDGFTLHFHDYKARLFKLSAESVSPLPPLASAAKSGFFCSLGRPAQTTVNGRHPHQDVSLPTAGLAERVRNQPPKSSSTVGGVL